METTGEKKPAGREPNRLATGWPLVTAMTMIAHHPPNIKPLGKLSCLTTSPTICAR